VFQRSDAFIQKLEKDIQIYNFTLVMKGGQLDRDTTYGNSKQVIKEYKSNIDFLPAAVQNPNHLGHVENPVLLESKTTPMIKLTPEEKLQQSVFSFNDVTFGLEICVDHGYKRLVKLQGQFPDKVNAVQVQLKPSCGKIFADESVLNRPNGRQTIAFGVDGLKCYEHRNKDGQFIGAHSEVVIYADGKLNQNIFWKDIVTAIGIPNRGWRYNTTVNELFSTSEWLANPPRIAVYPALTIPAKYPGPEALTTSELLKLP